MYRVLIVIIYAVSAILANQSDKWDENVRPKLVFDFIQEDPNNQSIKRFLGNHTHTDYFKLLRKDGNSLLIGARNIVYNLTLPSLQENIDQRITWDPKPQDQDLCLLKGKQEVDCQNYIRVLVKPSPDQLLVCGTNAYNPMCRQYLIQGSAEQLEKEFSGRGFCPYDPRHNSTFIYAEGELYAGTVADFSATDSLIIKQRLRTEQYDLKHLNEPHFVSSLEDEDHVYFFFRESAVEFMNCGKAIFSRVARVCKSDQGGPHKFRDNWTTFLKTRLNCSVPGEHPFYFDQVQSTSELLDGHLVYGVFTTPDNSISGSAICAFSLKDITQSLDYGPFKGQSTLNSNWLPMSKAEVPQPRPGAGCKSQTSEEGMNFIKRHTLMDKAVPTVHQQPLFIKTSLGERLTVIAVDSAVASADGTHHDVIFVGTTRGRVLKLVNSARSSTDKEPLPVLIEALQIFPYDVAVKNLLVVHESDQLIVLSETEVAALPLHRCGAKSANCGDCVALQDPYCAWQIKSNTCSPFRKGQEEQLQNVNIGYHPQCPVPILETTTTTKSTTFSTTTTTTTTTTLENVLEEETTLRNECPSCICECNKPLDLTTNDDEFVDLLDIYNGSDLDNGIFQDVPFIEIRNSLGVIKRQEKELNSFYEDVIAEEESVDAIDIDAAGPKVFSTTEDHYGYYSEETLALAIVLTAFVALILGLALGIFVTKMCWSPGKSTKKNPSTSDSSEEIHKYSVTTISTCDNGKTDQEFNQISVYSENQHLSLPPQFSSRHSIASSQPLSLNPANLEKQRPAMESFKSPTKSCSNNVLVSLPSMSAPVQRSEPSERSASRCSSLQQKVKRVYL